MYRPLEQWLAEQGIIPELISVISVVAGVVMIFLAAFIVQIIATRLLAPLLEKVVRRSSNQWDDILSGQGFFRKTA